MFNKLKRKDVEFFIGGILVLTLGIRVIGISNLGLAFSDAIFIKMSELFSIPASASSLILGFFTILVASILKKEPPKVLCLTSSFVLGMFVDFWMIILGDIVITNFILKVLVFLLGVLLLSMGVAIYLQPGFPPHPNDFLFMTIKDRFNVSIFTAKILMDCMFAIIALLMRAPIGLGSIFNTLCLGIFINKSFYIFERIYDSRP